MGANENTQKVLVSTDLVLILRTFISLTNNIFLVVFTLIF